MHRLFVAIRPPADQRAHLLSLMDGVDGARWQSDDQLHLTLRFIGAVDRHRANDIADALGAIRFAPFDVHLTGVGAFDRKGVVDTLWAGVKPRDPLAALHRKIDRACVSIGLSPESRAYLPHVTLARFGRSGGLIDPFLARHAALNRAPFRVDRFTLFESRLGQQGAIYHAIADYLANGAARPPLD
ncbi:RNA 2',3'-cyclic phosphodiesterase [Sphingobium cupriresistens]|uniref:RNA 2',3'-cyclic phosphodiesterase n=1 Tax=Sphingobium cupriresistens LL01 TaxID=1420583 RepID=A0A0J8ATN6_9SPHN|nr:RNA 2',3'-cyclic phosphodiesterase [Sphingobium cupriresistens]KMS57640.1 2'-5' RNA ligase [Sphingobium cupriresistens LL01]